MGMSDQLHAHATLRPGKEPPVVTEQEAGWMPWLVWMLQRRNKSVFARK